MVADESEDKTKRTGKKSELRKYAIFYILEWLITAFHKQWVYDFLNKNLWGLVLQVPPEALRPHKALNDITEHNDERDDTSYNESSACETDTFDETDIRSTRTEIVGNVVVKKKISGCRVSLSWNWN